MMVMMAASAGDKCTRVLGSQSGAGRVHCGKLHRKTSSTILWVNVEARTYVTVCEGQHYKSLNTYEPKYLDGNYGNIL